MTYIIRFPDQFSIFHLYYCISTTGDWSTCCNPHDLSWHYCLSRLEIQTCKKESIYFTAAKEKSAGDVTVFETNHKRKILQSYSFWENGIKVTNKYTYTKEAFI